jgi:hypothetical protein
MSGSPNISVPLAVAEEMHKQDFVANTPCANVGQANLLDCLYNLNVSAIVNAVGDVWNPGWLFGLPTPGSVISPLAIVDGVTVPFSIFDAYQYGTAVDVPGTFMCWICSDSVVIFGTMHEEVDLAPQDIVFNYTASQWNQFVQSRYVIIQLYSWRYIQSLQAFTKGTNVHQVRCFWL